MAKKQLFASDQPPLDAELLTSEEIAELSGEVQAEVNEERKEAARKALKEKLHKEARQKSGLAEAQDTVTIDLAPYTDRLLIDNVAYLQGRTYTVPVGRAAVLREQMQRTWGHQSEIDGKSENFYRKARAPRVIPVGENGTAVITTSQLLRA